MKKKIQKEPRQAKADLLINKKAVKKFALTWTKGNRYHPFTRVSKEFLLTMDAQLRNIITTHISGLPSKGKTI